jgi:REP element-mobilizing transposase RayT
MVFQPLRVQEDLMARSRYKIFEGNAYPHFLTCTVINWLPLFSNPTIAQFALDTLKFLQDNNRLIIYVYVIMENHLHLIAMAENLAKEIANFKSYTARLSIDFYKEQGNEFVLSQLAFHKAPYKVDRPYQFWEEGSHPKQIQNLGMMRQKVEYLHTNPVRRGYVDEPIHWRYSSARNYEGMSGLLDVTTEW